MCRRDDATRWERLQKTWFKLQPVLHEAEEPFKAAEHTQSRAPNSVNGFS
jgi:hypothetical protein